MPKLAEWNIHHTAYIILHIEYQYKYNIDQKFFNAMFLASLHKSPYRLQIMIAINMTNTIHDAHIYNN